MIKRLNRFSFQDAPANSKASICQPCYENSITSKLEEYDKDPDHFMICPYCNNIVNKRLIRLGPVVFEAVHIRRSRSKLNRDSEEVFKVEYFPIAGKEDSDLRHFANQGFIVSVSDSGNEGIEEQY